MITYNPYTDLISFTGKESLGVLNVLKTRHLSVANAALLDFLLANRSSVVLHVLCSGMGATSFEPGVPGAEKVREAVEILVANGFPVSQMVLRIQPLFINSSGMRNAERVLNLFRDSGICRVRYEPLNMTKRLQAEFMKNYGRIPVITHDPKKIVGDLYDFIHSYGYYDFETDLTGSYDFLPVVSTKDLLTLGISATGFFTFDNHGALPYRAIGKHRCNAGCIYCKEVNCE